MRHEVGLAREQFDRDVKGLHEKIGEVQRSQIEDRARVIVNSQTLAEHGRTHLELDRRLRDVESDCGTLGQEVARLDERTSTVDDRTRNVQPALGLSLSRSQKTMLAAALSAVGVGLLDLARHAITFVIAYLQHKPTHP